MSSAYVTAMQISINVKPDLVTQIDGAKGAQSRSAFIVACILEHLITDNNADTNHLTEQLEAYKSKQQRLENEVAYLRQEYSKINDALAQRLFTESTSKECFGRGSVGKKNDDTTTHEARQRHVHLPGSPWKRGKGHQGAGAVRKPHVFALPRLLQACML